MLTQLTEARDKVQTELAEAEIALLESTARAEALRDEVWKLDAAVAALSGEKPPAEPTAQNSGIAQEVERDPDTIEVEGSTPSSATSGIHEMSAEEFDKERKRRQRSKQKELDAANPYSEVPCGGCGTKGSLNDSFVTAPSGASIRMLVCSKCNNQIMQ